MRNAKLNILTVNLIILLFLSPLGNILLASNDSYIPVDTDFVQFDVKNAKDAPSHILTAESKRGGAIDWITYVIKVDPTEVISDEEFLNDIADNRRVYDSEDNVVEVIHIPARSWSKYLDFTAWAGMLIDAYPGKMKDRALIPTDDGGAYVIRSYSGAFGLLADKEEKAFVKEKVDEGANRNSQALLMNFLMGGIDAVTPYLPVAGSGVDLLKVSMGKAITVVLAKYATHAFIAEGQPFDVESGLVFAQDIGQTLLDVILGELTEMGLETGIETVAKKSALKKVVSFTNKLAGAALNNVNFVKKISKGGQVVERLYDMGMATPLETAYIVNTPLTVEEEIEEEIEVAEDEEIIIKEEENPEVTINEPENQESNNTTIVASAECNLTSEEEQLLNAPDLTKLGSSELNSLAEKCPQALLNRLKTESKEVVEDMSSWNGGPNVISILAEAGYAGELVTDVLDVADISHFTSSELNTLAEKAPKELLNRLKTESKEVVEDMSSWNGGPNVISILAEAGYAGELVTDVLDVADISHFTSSELNTLAEKAPKELLNRLKTESKEVVEDMSSWNGGPNVISILAEAGYAGELVALIEEVSDPKEFTVRERELLGFE